MTSTSRIRAAFDDFTRTSREARVARAERTRLEDELRLYTATEADRVEMDAILNRYPESDTHLAWGTVTSAAA